MKTARRITRNFLILTVSEVIAKFLQLAIFIFLARFYKPEIFGHFGFALAFSSIVAIIADFGLSQILIREISRDKENVGRYVSNALVSKLFLSVGAFLVAFGYLWIFDYGDELKAVAYFMVLFMVIQSFTDIFYSVFRAFERMQYDAMLKVLRMVMLSALVAMSLGSGASLTTTIAMFPATEAFVMVVSMLIYSRKFKGASFGLDYSFTVNLLKKSSLFCLSMAFVSLLFYIDSIMLERMRGVEEVGVYTAAFNLLVGLTFIPLMYANVIFPVFSRYFVADRELLRFAFRKSYSYMFMLGLPIAIGIFFYAENIIALIYGDGYGRSILALKILASIMFFRFLNLVSGTLLSSVNKQHSRVLSQGIVAATNIILNIMLIPRFGFAGAGIATVISEGLFLLLYTFFVRRYGLGFGGIKTYIKPIGASIIMASVLYFISDLFLGAILGAAVYIACLIAFRAFGKEDKVLLMRILKDI